MSGECRLFFTLCAILLSVPMLFSCAREPDPMESALSRAFPGTNIPAPAETGGETEELPSAPLPTEPEEDPSVLYSDAWMKWFKEQTALLEAEFPAGSYWNHKGMDKDYLGVTDSPCNHHDLGPLYCNTYTCASATACGWEYGTQCAGFAGLLSDRIFGKDAPVYKFYDYDAIRPGDQARINNNYHTVFILEKTDEYVVVAECNAGGMNDCKIAWGRVIPRDKLGGFYLTRAE